MDSQISLPTTGKKQVHHLGTEVNLIMKYKNTTIAFFYNSKVYFYYTASMSSLPEPFMLLQKPSVSLFWSQQTQLFHKDLVLKQREQTISVLLNNALSPHFTGGCLSDSPNPSNYPRQSFRPQKRTLLKACILLFALRNTYRQPIKSCDNFQAIKVIFQFWQLRLENDIFRAIRWISSNVTESWQIIEE